VEPVPGLVRQDRQLDTVSRLLMDDLNSVFQTFGMSLNESGLQYRPWRPS
jgi:hypothetical protein